MDWKNIINTGFILFLCFVLCYSSDVKPTKDMKAIKDMEKKMKKVAMTKKEVDKVEQLHFGWYVQAVSSLIGAMGKELYLDMDRSTKKAFVACMSKIEKEYDVQMGAKCLVKALDGELLSSFPDAVHSPQFDFVDKDPNAEFLTKKVEKKKKKTKKILKKVVVNKIKKRLDESEKKKSRKAHTKKALTNQTNQRTHAELPTIAVNKALGIPTVSQKVISPVKLDFENLHESKSLNQKSKKNRLRKIPSASHKSSRPSLSVRGRPITVEDIKVNDSLEKKNIRRSKKHHHDTVLYKRHRLDEINKKRIVLDNELFEKDHDLSPHSKLQHLNIRKFHQHLKSNRDERAHRSKRNILSLYANKEMMDEAKRIDKSETSHGYAVKTMDKAPSLISAVKSPVKSVTKLLGSVVRTLRNQTEEEALNYKQSYDKINKLQDMITKKSEANQFKHRMLDMVLGKNHPLRMKKTLTDRLRDVMTDTPHVEKEQLFSLIDSVSKHTDEVNFNMLSPRFLPIMPDKFSSSKKLLSPNLFPLYKDDSENSILPIPTVLEKVGLNDKDRESIMELVMDVAGVNQAVDQALDAVNIAKSLHMDKDIVGVTQVLDDIFKSVQDSLHPHQQQHLENRQYTFLEKEQLKKLFGEEGLMNVNEDFPFDIDSYMNLTLQEREDNLRNTIRLIADGKMEEADNHVKRSKRQVEIDLFPPFRIAFYKHVTLAPYAFSPTLNTLSVLGPVILSPSIFSPNIISPLLLSPPILSPQVGNPLIFSPYVLGPNIMSAAVFNAYVFSPYVLAPNIVNPYVMSPLILSPFVLCPDILSPTVLSGVVLSPSVLSPSVFTESALAANVLSPTFLS